MTKLRRPVTLAAIALGCAAGAAIGAAAPAAAETWATMGTYRDADYGGHNAAFGACAAELPNMHVRARCIEANPRGIAGWDLQRLFSA